MRDKAYINSEILTWARETAKIRLEVAASKIQVTAERLKEWELGTDLPTIKKAEMLAKIYRRPFALFFLPHIPTDFTPLQDFRIKGSKELTTSSVFIIREIQQKQEWLKELYIDNKQNSLSFVGRFSTSDSVQLIAQDIIQTLKVTPMQYGNRNPILTWIECAEKNGIFVSRTGNINSHLKLDSEELQGFAIADEYAPFVFINSDDWDAPQLFTFVHELAHIWIAESGISNELEPTIKNRQRFHPIEIFCSEIAANALMPIDIMESLKSEAYSNYRNVRWHAKQFGVSSLAFLYRGYNLKYISLEYYNRLKAQADYEFQEFLKNKAKDDEEKRKEQKDLPIYYPIMINRNGRLFIQTVLDAFRGGSIEPTVASSLLNIQVTKFPKLEDNLYK